MFARIAAPLVAVGALCLAACSDEIVPAAGTVTVVVSSNLLPGVDYDSGLLVVARSGASSVNGGDYDMVEILPAAAAGALLPLTFVVRQATPSDEPSSRPAPPQVQVRLMFVSNARGNQLVTLVRDMVFQLPDPQEQKMVHVSLDWLSMTGTGERQQQTLFELKSTAVEPFPASYDCSGGTRDARGECGSVVVAEDGAFDRRLEPLDLTTVWGGADSPTASTTRCWSAARCMAQHEKLELKKDAQGCHVTLPSAGVAERLSVALNTAQSDKQSATYKAKPAAGASQTAQDAWENRMRALRCAANDADVETNTLGCGDQIEAGLRAVVLDREVYSVEGARVNLPAQVCQRLEVGTDAVLVSSACPSKERALPLCLQAGRDGRVAAVTEVTP